MIAQEKQGSTEYFQMNGRGDVTGLTDSSGENVKTFAYDAFGNQLSENEVSSTPFRYNGEYYDEETDLIYLRNRYYSPSVGQFITEDPAKDGTNWYVYCGNNPIMFVDPLGLAITQADRDAYESGQISQEYWEMLNDANDMWNSALEDDYTTKAIAHYMTTVVRQLYDPDYVDDFDYTFGTGELAIDFGDYGNYMKTFSVINADGSGGIARISYSRVERNGKAYLKLNNVRVRSFSGRRRIKTGIWGYMGQTNSSRTKEFWSDDCYIFEIADFGLLPDDQGLYTAMGVYVEFQFNSGTVVMALNVYTANYDDIHGDYHDDERMTSFPGMGGGNWTQHPSPR